MALLLGCQRLPEPEGSGAGTGQDESSSTFLPGVETDDPGADSSGGPPPDPTVCFEDRSISYLEVDSPQDLAGVEIVRGPLRLENMTDEDMQWVQCLRRVSDIQHIRGSLHIGPNPTLTNLDALRHLESVSSTLSVRDNAALENLDGLASLTDVEWLVVGQNPVLTSVAGLEQVVTFNLELWDNPALPSATFSAVSELGLLDVDRNDQLATLSFPQLTTANIIQLRRLPQLSTLDGLAAIEDVGRFEVRELDTLASAAGLASLQEVSQSILVWMLPALDELVLPSLSRAPTLSVFELPLLERIELPAIEQLDTVVFGTLPLLGALPNLPTSAGLRSIWLDDLPMILTLDALHPGDPVMSRVVLSDMPALDDFDALVGITSIEDELLLAQLPQLDSLAFLAEVTRLGGATFDSLPLTSLVGLEQLQAAGQLQLIQLDGLTSLDELGGLTEVGDLVVQSNAQLASLQGLDNVAAIWRLWIVDNPALTSIDALPEGSLSQFGERLEITGNATLSQCDAEMFLQSLLDGGWLGEYEVANNGPC